MSRPERASVALPAAGVLALAVAVVLATVSIGSAMLSQARADAAADMVALAAATGGEPAASRIATANDTRVTSLRSVPSDGGETWVVRVHRGGSEAVAAAQAGCIGDPPAGLEVLCATGPG